MIICDCEKEESIFISKTIGMSMFTSITLDDASNLSLMELCLNVLLSTTNSNSARSSTGYNLVMRLSTEHVVLPI